MYLTYLISSIIQIKTLENMQVTLINKIKKINLLTFASFEQGKLFAMVVQESKVLSRVLARVVNGIRDVWLLIIFSSALIVVSPVMAMSGLFFWSIYKYCKRETWNKIKKGRKVICRVN